MQSFVWSIYLFTEFPISKTISLLSNTIFLLWRGNYSPTFKLKFSTLIRACLCITSSKYHLTWNSLSHRLAVNLALNGRRRPTWCFYKERCLRPWADVLCLSQPRDFTVGARKGAVFATVGRRSLSVAASRLYCRSEERSGFNRHFYIRE